ncbi:hypothetical protein B0A49_11647 [Cryomyces minteri]|uniref:HAT C-terminal dimerisation domain-containing protein n=1 Tax=Cryomyces minteri TaxID=331657 RepID=A0A4U0X464_9PEZI|nr:hypothetical protein B0A49_11647 [Cryomyces minteri]
MFSPLATYYSQEVDKFLSDGGGLTHTTKRQFWKLFHEAWKRAFTEKNVKSAWEAAGVHPFNPERVIAIITQKNTTPEPQQVRTPTSARSLRRMFNHMQKDGYVTAEALPLLHASEKLATKVEILQHKNQGLEKAIVEEKKKRKRGRKLNLHEEGENPEKAHEKEERKTARVIARETAKVEREREKAKRAAKKAAQEANATTQASRHLEAAHRITKKGQIPPSVVPRKRESVADQLQRAHRAQQTAFDERACTPWRFRELLGYRNPLIEGVAPSSHNTPRTWITQYYELSKETVRRSLNNAVSRITLSFDLWTSNSTHKGNGMPLLGVVGHYLDKDIKLRTVLLGLPLVLGQHSGENIARYLLSVINDFSIGNKLGYSVADNATNNDTCLTELAKDLDINVKQQRLRCAGHKINLVCKAILLGTDTDCYEDVLRNDEEEEAAVDDRIEQFEAVLDSSDQAKAWRAWHKKGPVGKQPSFKLDRLTSDDWTELTQIHYLLKPFKALSTRLQGNAVTGGHGALWESLAALDYLLTHLEEQKQQQDLLQPSHFKACVNLGWKKLNKYYELTHRIPAYAASVALHPARKYSWFTKHWKDTHPDWIEKAKAATRKQYKQYKRQYASEVRRSSPTSSELADFDHYNRIDHDDTALGDELDRFASSAPIACKDPLQWWRNKENHEQYPVLRHLAWDLLAVPAMSAECERVFSEAGHVLNTTRALTTEELAEASQCLKSWIESGLVSLTKVSDDDDDDDEVQSTDYELQTHLSEPPLPPQHHALPCSHPLTTTPSPKRLYHDAWQAGQQATNQWPSNKQKSKD